MSDDRAIAEWERDRKIAKCNERRNALYASGMISEPTAKSLHCMFGTRDRWTEETNAAAWGKVRKLDIKDMRGTNLYFVGPCSAGKTTAARCLLNRAIWFGYSAAEVTARSILRIGTTFASDDGKSQIWKECQRVAFLLLDDIDKAEFNRSGTLEAMLELINARGGDKCTIFTSNILPLAFKNILAGYSAKNPTISSAIYARMTRGLVAVPFPRAIGTSTGKLTRESTASSSSSPEPSRQMGFDSATDCSSNTPLSDG